MGGFIQNGLETIYLFFLLDTVIGANGLMDLYSAPKTLSRKNAMKNKIKQSKMASTSCWIKQSTGYSSWSERSQILCNGFPFNMVISQWEQKKTAWSRSSFPGGFSWSTTVASSQLQRGSIW